MSNDIKFFTHDTRSRFDKDIQKMLMKEGQEGMAALGIFWCLVEMVHEEHGYIMLTECERIAFELRTQIELLKRVIFNYGLFKKDDTRFWNNRAIRNLQGIYTKSSLAKKSAEARWGKGGNSGAMRSHSKSNTKKKEKKINIEFPPIPQTGELTENEKLFEAFRVTYPGTKRSLATEFAYFKKTHKNWVQIIPVLMGAVQKQMLARETMRKSGAKFIPSWKHLKTWIYNRGWEEEMQVTKPIQLPGIVKEVMPIESIKKYRDYWVKHGVLPNPEIATKILIGKKKYEAGSTLGNLEAYFKDTEVWPQ